MNCVMKEYAISKRGHVALTSMLCDNPWLQCAPFACSTQFDLKCHQADTSAGKAEAHQHPRCILLSPFFHGFAQRHVWSESDGSIHSLACGRTSRVALCQPSFNVSTLIPDDKQCKLWCPGLSFVCMLETRLTSQFYSPKCLCGAECYISSHQNYQLAQHTSRPKNAGVAEQCRCVRNT